MPRLPLPTLLALVSLLAASACGDSAGQDDGPAGEGSLRGTLTVFAAASLTDAFNQLATEFRKLHAGVEIAFNFAGSPTLRTQLEQGARADIFASADVAQMELARQSGVVADKGRVFAHNSLVVILPRDNPSKLESIGDLKWSGLKLVLANPEVPVGNYALQMLTAMETDAAYGAGFKDAVLKNVVSYESNVKQVVVKVELGEADAGIVYGTDVSPSLASKLATLEVPARFNVLASYPIASTVDTRNRRAAEAFIAFVLSSEGQAVLSRWGFKGANQAAP